MDKAIGQALKTWYDKDHSLHFDPLHPAIGLAGEAGELLDLLKKEMFKDGVSWWDCVHCNEKHKDAWTLRSDKIITEVICENYTPKILDELGDLWFYIRILAYQRNVDIIDCIKYYHENKNSQQDATTIIALTNVLYWSSRILHDIVFPAGVPKDRLSDYPLVRLIFWLKFLLVKLDYTLDQLTELNWQKLKDGDNHGWRKD